jgi:hypothetical protein
MDTPEFPDFFTCCSELARLLASAGIPPQGALRWQVLPLGSNAQLRLGLLAELLALLPNRASCIRRIE